MVSLTVSGPGTVIFTGRGLAACASAQSRGRKRSRGGRTTWENVVTACAVCNLKKGGRRLKECRMQPRVWPYKPSVYELQNIGRSFPPNYLHESWRDYLYWDTELEP